MRKFKKFLKNCVETSRDIDGIYEKNHNNRCEKCKIFIEMPYSIPSGDGKFISVCYKCYLNYKAELNKKEADKPKYNLYIKNAINSVDHSKIPYCESPALGMGAPKCSEDCCDYGACHKEAYFDFIEKKYPHAEILHSCQDCGVLLTPDQEGKICETASGIVYFLCKKCYKAKNDSLVANQSDKFVVEDREYSNEEVLEILKKHKAEEDKKYHKCERCGEKYIDNLSINMAKEGLDRERDGHCSAWGNYCGAWGYTVTPYLTGLKVTSKCGEGRKIKLCDHCVEDLLKFLKGEKYDNNN